MFDVAEDWLENTKVSCYCGSHKRELIVHLVFL